MKIIACSGILLTNFRMQREVVGALVLLHVEEHPESHLRDAHEDCREDEEDAASELVDYRDGDTGCKHLSQRKDVFFMLDWLSSHSTHNRRGSSASRTSFKRSWCNSTDVCSKQA